jgi:hypothetical protein
VVSKKELHIMNVNDLKENLKRVISLRDEIMELKKENRRTYSLREYVELFRDRLIHIDHGEIDKFWWPMHIALTKLDELSDIEENKFNSQFSANKRKLLSTINRYTKEMQIELQEHDLV